MGSFLDGYGKNCNLGLLRRFERASAHSPIRDLSLEQHDAMLGIFARTLRWEDLPEEWRRMVEESEANRREADKNPVISLKLISR